MAGFGLIRKYLAGESMGKKESVLAPDKSGFTKKQREAQMRGSSVTAISAINTKRKAMNEVMGK